MHTVWHGALRAPSTVTGKELDKSSAKAFEDWSRVQASFGFRVRDCAGFRVSV